MSGDKSKCLFFFSGFIIGFVFGTTYYNSHTNDSQTNDSQTNDWQTNDLQRNEWQTNFLNTKDSLKIFYDPAPRNCV